MRKKTLLAALTLLFVHAGSAQEAASPAAFNEAWQAYVDVRDSRDKQATLTAAKQVLDIGEQILVSDDERLPYLVTNHGAALLQAGEVDAARDELERAVELAENAFGEQSEKLIPLISNLADGAADLGSPARQIRHYRRGLQIIAEHHGKDSLEYADMLLRTGIGVITLSRSISGEKFLRNAYDIYAKHPESDPIQTARAAFWIGKTRISRQNPKAATDHLLDALQRLQDAQVPDTEFELTVRAHLVTVYEERGLSDLATEHCMAIGAQRADRSDRDFLPLFRMAPSYPATMLQSRTQGHVDFSFTVDKNGFVREPVVIKREGGKAFESAALAAVERFRYAPRFDNGKPVPVEDVKTRITFKIED